MDNQQPGLTLTYTMMSDGPFDQLGTIRTWATNFAPGGDISANGQLLPITGNEDLFSQIGTIYGGDGLITFGIPDLDGRVAVGQGQGPGLSNRAIGSQFGSDAETLSLAQYPTELGGTSNPVNNVQASQAVDYIINTGGSFPSRNYGGGDNMLGMILPTAVNPVNPLDSEWMYAHGQTLLIQDHSALFSILGTTYGGDGRQTFNLPDLRGVAPVGAGQAPGLDNIRLGQRIGSETYTITDTNLPGQLGGGAQGIDNYQPSLGLNYIIALQGIFPSRDGQNPVGGVEPYLGEVFLFAGNFAPRGYAFAHGQTLAVSQYEALFSLLGTQFGGDGRTTFALPDLRGTVAIGSGQFNPVASQSGSSDIILQRGDFQSPDTPVITGFSEDSSVVGDNITSESSLEISGTAVANTNVEVFANGVSLGTTPSDDTGNWTFDATNLADDVHGFSAKISVGGFPSRASDSLVVTVDTAALPPVITGITDDTGVAANDGITTDTTLTLSGTTEAGGVVEVFLGATKIDTVTANVIGAWSSTYATPLAEGQHSFTAQVTDVAGNASAASDAFLVTVDTTDPDAPVITGISDDTGGSGNDAITSDTTLTVSGTAEANAVVDVFLGAANIGTVNANGAGAWSLNHATPLAEGQHSFTAQATDLAGNGSAASAAFLVTVDTTAPLAPAITGVSDDTGSSSTDRITSDTTLTLQGMATANSTVEVYLGATRLGTATADNFGDWSYVHAATLTEGPHSFTAVASDTAGNSATSAAFDVTVDTTAPTAPVITGISDDTGASATDGITSDTTLTLQGMADPNATVEVFLGATRVGSATADNFGDWAYIHAATLADGQHAFSARVTDTAGNAATSAAFQVAVDTAPPLFNAGGTLAVNVAENTTAVLTAAATDAQQLTFTITGGADQALFDLDAASGDLSFKVAPDFEAATKSADGDNDYLVTVTATDAAGLTADQDITISVTDVNENAGGGGGTQDPIEPNDPLQPNDPVVGGDADDVFRLDGLTGPVTVDGGDGEDTVILDVPIGEVTIGLSPVGYTFTTPDGLIVTVDNVENVQFNDRSIMMDTSPEAKVVLFMYEVLLDRFMDLEGLSGWLDTFGTGSSFGEIADGFLNSPEFAQSFGPLTNDAFVTLLYDSAFDRDPDQAGFDGWLMGLNDGTLTRGDVAAAFAQSAEMGGLFQPHLDDGVFVLV